VLLQNESIDDRFIKDGMSNTLAIVEQSRGDYKTIVQPGNRVEFVSDESVFRSSHGAGAWGGNTLDRPPIPRFDGMNCHFVFNITTIRYPINFHNTPALGAGLGTGGANKPISSAHTGVANVLFCDGHVRNLRENIEFGVLMMLADRDDKGVLKDGAF